MANTLFNTPLTSEVLQATDLEGVAEQATLTAVQTALNTANSTVNSISSSVETLKTDVADIKSNVQSLTQKWCSIVVECTTTDNTTVTGQTVTLRTGSSAEGQPYGTRPYNGQPVTFTVPYGYDYFVQVTSTLAGHYAPTTAVVTAESQVVNVNLVYQSITTTMTYAGIKAVIDSVSTVEEGRAALSDVSVEDTWTSDSGNDTYDDPARCVDVQMVTDPDGRQHIAAIMARKYATANDIQFDAPEQETSDPETELTAQQGHFYFGYGARFSSTSTYAVNKYCSYGYGIYVCTTAVESAGEWTGDANWTLKDAVEYSNLQTYSVGDVCKYSGKLYTCATAVETAEDFDAEKWTLGATAGFQDGALVALKLGSGVEIPYSGYLMIITNDVSQTDTNLINYGYNNWEYSAWRQYLNSDGALGEWWYKTHTGACPPRNAATTRGYKAGCSTELLQYAKPIKVPCYANSVTDGSKIYNTVDTFWLMSGTEIYGSVNQNEGDPLQYIKTQTGFTSASNSNTSGRIYRRVSAKSSSVTWRTRSSSRSDSCIVWGVSAGGTVNSYNYASSAFAGVPAWAIY